ncbi:hypothetical protein A2U01_0113614, partial [Trifolium medium]|nr:hypothetical protein [Trifolium medium]
MAGRTNAQIAEALATLAGSWLEIISPDGRMKL